MSTTRTWTEAELMALPGDGWKRELVDGEIVVSPAGAPHGQIILRLASRILTHVDEHGLGFVFDSSTGCWMPSRNLRVPDITFVSHERMPGGITEGFLKVVPDLVVEVLSPGDSKALMRSKVREYLEAGIRLVWVIDPTLRLATCHRPGHDPGVVREDESLDGEDVLPGFGCRLADVLR